MTHEIKEIFEAYAKAKKQKVMTVLATVVALNGSSYRKPGVRMLLEATGKMTGAVSGGCVEKEIWRQAQSVFSSGEPKIMTYDGRFRLGCEGVLHILIEPFGPSGAVVKKFNRLLNTRKTFELCVYFETENKASNTFGSVLVIGDEKQPLRTNLKLDTNLNTLVQKMEPCFKLLIIGTEHDAVALSTTASQLGWEVTIVAGMTNEKPVIHFTGAKELLSCDAEYLDSQIIDSHTAVVLMTHSYAQDLKYLLRIKNTTPKYIGILGPAKRREKLLNEVLENDLNISDSFFDTIYGPAGLNIGAITPQEIALSICSEILTLTRNQQPISLRDKVGTTHTKNE